MDENRSRQTAAWHYVNLPQGDCDYVKARDCRDGAWVVEALTAQASILKSNAPDAERPTALKYVVHLVGDVHQPLHAGYASDKGGNTYQVQAFDEGMNLHALWDSGLLNNCSGGPAAFKGDLAANLSGRAAGAHRMPPNGPRSHARSLQGLASIRMDLWQVLSTWRRTVRL